MVMMFFLSFQENDKARRKRRIVFSISKAKVALAAIHNQEHGAGVGTAVKVLSALKTAAS